MNIKKKKTKTIKQKTLSIRHASNCPICNSELIWGGDHDIDDEYSEHGIVTNLSCSNEECGAFVEVYWNQKEPSVSKKGKRKVKYKSGMVSSGGVEHINPDTTEIDFD
jgi:transcription elongation factor Elf1